MQGCIHIGDEALYQLVRRCSRLQLVNLHGCRNVQDDGVMELAENSPALRFQIFTLENIYFVFPLKVNCSKYYIATKIRKE